MYMRIKHNKNVYIWKLGTCWWYLRWMKQPINFSHKISLLDSYLLTAQKNITIHKSAYCLPGNQACSEPSQRTKHSKSKITHCPFLHLVLKLSGNWHVPAFWHSLPPHYLELGCSFIQAAPQPNYPRTSSSKFFAATSRNECTSLHQIIASTFRLK